MAFPSAVKKALADRAPKIHPGIKQGFASMELKGIAQYIDEYLRAASKEWPNSCQYIDYRICKPYEVLDFTKSGRTDVNGRGEKYTREISKSTTFLIVLRFKTSEGEIIERPVALPYTRDHRYSEFVMNDALWFIAPVVADSILTITNKDIFIRLETARLTFECTKFTVLKNGAFDVGSIIHSKIHHNPSPNDIKAKHVSVHYLLCKYGFTETFRRYVGVVPVLGNSSTITEEKYPPNEWYVFRNTKQYKAKSYVKNIAPSDVSIAVKKVDYSDTLHTYICSVLYICSFFDEATVRFFDNTTMWRTLLGKIIFGCSSPDERLVSNINTHISTTDVYLDMHSKQRLENVEINGEQHYCEDFYDLLALVTNKYLTWTYGTSDIYECWGREVSVLRWAAQGYIQAINRLTMELKQQQIRNKPVSHAKILKDLRRYFNTKGVYSLIRKHGEFTGYQYPGDNPLYSIGITLTPQRKAHKTDDNRSRINTNDPAFALRASMVDVYALVNMAKAAPTGDTRGSPWMSVVNNTIVPRRGLEMTYEYLRSSFVRPFMEGDGAITLIELVDEDEKEAAADYSADFEVDPDVDPDIETEED